MSVRTHIRTTSLSFLSALVVGCGEEPTSPAVTTIEHVQAPSVPVSLDWQERARELVGENRMSALAAGRAYAALSVAQRLAIEVADGRSSYALAGIPAGGAHVGVSAAGGGGGGSGRSRAEARRGAVAGASAQVLTWLFPAAAVSLEEMVTEQGEAGPGKVHPQFVRGVAIGRKAGDALIEHLQNDGFTATWTGTVPVGPGMWVPSALPPAGVMLGQVKPYLLKSGSQFRPAPPPEFLSPAFNADLAEVRTLTDSITPEQLAFARYWDFPGGSPTPLGYWNEVASTYIAQDALDEKDATHVLALVHVAMFDALIGCWEAKYHYWTLRPSHADPDISLAFTLPNFPSYPSGHSCASASGARVLAHFFPDRTPELAQMVEDAGLSRILAGIHYRFDITAGQKLGSDVAEWTLERSKSAR